MNWERPPSIAISGGEGSAALERLFATVKEAVSRRRDIARWSITVTRTASHELYLVREDVESERRGQRHTVEARVQTEKGKELGSASFSLGLGEEALLDSKLATAVEVARAATVEAYPAPEPSPLPAVQTLDPEIVRDSGKAVEELRAQILLEIGRQRDVRLASAELFLYHDERRMETSNGLVADLSGTRATAEIVVLGSGSGGRESEVQDLRQRRTGADLALPGWTAELSQQARDGVRAEAMRTWEGPVVLHGDALNTYFGPMVGRLSAESLHQGMSPFQQGGWVTAAEIRGDAVTLSTDRTLPFGLSTAPCDPDGIPAAADLIVEAGRVRRFWADARHAHYLDIPATGSWANTVVEPGSRAGSDLFGGGEVLEVVRFSWFTPSPGSGDFSSEMRFGYLHRNGARVPVKGGAVTGNTYTGLEEAYFSREREFVGDAHVPRFMRVERFAVVGA